MPVTDTSWLYALLAPNDPHHARARRDAESGVALVVPAVILAELLQLVHWRAKEREGAAKARRVARRVLQDLQGIPTLRVEPAFDVAAAHRVYTGSLRLSYPDSIAVAMARTTPGGLLTFDEAQAAVLRSA